MERFKMIASGYGFFIKKNKILLSERKNTGYMDGWFSLPAGHIEDGESLIHGTTRELAEEVGVVVREEQLQLVHVMHRKSDDIRMDFFFLVSGWKNEPANMEPDKCSRLEWVFIDELPKNTIPYIRSAINHYTQSVLYSEFGW